MGRELFDVLPQILNRIEVGRVRGQLDFRQAIGMRGEKLRHGFAGVIACPILNHKDMVGRLCQDIKQKGCRAVRVESLRMGFVEQASRNIVDESKAFVGFAYATGRHFGLVSLGSPGVAQGAPLSKTGLITEQQQGFALACFPEHLRPGGLTPLQPGCLIKMGRDKARFLIRKAEVVQ